MITHAGSARFPPAGHERPLSLSPGETPVQFPAGKSAPETGPRPRVAVQLVLLATRAPAETSDGGLAERIQPRRDSPWSKPVPDCNALESMDCKRRSA